MGFDWLKKTSVLHLRLGLFVISGCTGFSGFNTTFLNFPKYVWDSRIATLEVNRDFRDREIQVSGFGIEKYAQP